MSQTDEPLVAITFEAVTLQPSGTLTVGIEVTNKGKAPINEIKVEWVFENEVPQEATAEFKALHGADIEATGRRVVKAEDLGGRYCFACAKGQTDGPLEPGASRLYLYPSEWVEGMISRVQALSPERYHIDVTMNGKRDVAIPGPRFGEFVEREFVGKK